MTPEQELKWLAPAFKNLFENDPPDLKRFLRLLIDVLDPATGYKGKCAGDGYLLPTGCGRDVEFKVAERNGAPCGYLCPNCGAIFLWSLCKGPRKGPRRVVLTDSGVRGMGSIKSESDSGVIISDGPYTATVMPSPEVIVSTGPFANTAPPPPEMETRQFPPDANSLGESVDKIDRAKQVLDRKSAEHGAKVCTTDGKLPDPDYDRLDSAPQPVKDNGQHGAYYVLCEEERAKGFVRPVRNAYRHKKCGTVTTMGRALAETYARDPHFYGATMCVRCGTHFYLRENGEYQFTWINSDGTDGEGVGEYAPESAPTEQSS